ncbi:MAG: hypothetical protein HON70_41680, partial [Lentisphaerae bacterium]|nr:hypothetical protein [Lentisphaerota bacterium]
HIRAWIDENGDQQFAPDSEAHHELTDIDPVGNPSPFMADLLLTDVDGEPDGLPDWWEILHFADTTAGPYADPDGDGVTNVVEYGQGTDPMDPADRPQKPVSVGPVSVDAGFLLLDGREFAIRGTVYHPVPVGRQPGYTSTYAETVLDRDIPRLVELGTNTVLIPEQIPEESMLMALDAFDDAGIKVILGYAINPARDLTNSLDRAALIAGFSEYVTSAADHPALLMWCIGTEGTDATFDPAQWYNFVSSMAWTAFDVEGDAYHPTTTVNTGLMNIAQYAGQADGIDLWGVAYRGQPTFDTPGDSTLFADYAVLDTGKPMWVASYGIDAWDSDAADGTGRPNEPRQAKVAVDLSQALNEGSSVPGVFNAGLDLIVAGAPADGEAGIRGNLMYEDTDTNGVWDDGEPAWADVVDSLRGRYELGFDTAIAGIDQPDGTAGTLEGVSFEDLNGDNAWNENEPIWADQQSGEPIEGTNRVAQLNLFDQAVDQIVHPGDGAPADRTLGRPAGLAFHDVNDNGVRDPDELVWLDTQIGTDGTYDHGDGNTDAIVAGTPTDGTQGVPRGLYFNDDNENGEWDSGEPVWRKGTAGVVGGVYANTIDPWWPEGAVAQQDLSADTDVDLEHFGLFRRTDTAPYLDPRVAFFALRRAWNKQSDVINLPTRIRISEDGVGRFFLRALGFGSTFELVRPQRGPHTGGLNGNLDGWDETGLELLTYTPDEDFVGADRVDYRLVDPQTRETRNGEIIIIVDPVDDAPKDLTVTRAAGTIAHGETVSVAEANDLVLSLSAREVDGQEITFTYSASERGELAGAQLSETTYDAQLGAWVATLTYTPGYAEATQIDPTKSHLVTVTGTDTTDQASSIEFTVAVTNVNRQPQALAVTLAPEKAFAKEAVTVTYQFNDLDVLDQDDGSPTVEWFRVVQGTRSDEPIDGFSGTSISLPAAGLLPGEGLTCSVSPSDGLDQGAFAQATNTVSVLNDVADITTAPVPPRTGDDLSFSVSWLDPAGQQHPYDIEWLKNDVASGTQLTVPSADTLRGQAWQVRLTPYDTVRTETERRSTAPSLSALVEIADTPPPTPTAAEYAVDLPQPDDALSIVNVVHDEDADGDTITLEIEWDASADFAAGQLRLELPASETAMKDTWYARVRTTAPDGARGSASSEWFDLTPVRIGLVTHDLQLSNGWNLISLPLMPVDRLETAEIDESTADGLFGALKIGNAWYWGGDTDRYVPVDGEGDTPDTLQALWGMWVYHDGQRAPRQTALTVFGWPLLNDTRTNEQGLALEPGWNLLGPYVDFLTAPPDDPAIAGDSIWRWVNDGVNPAANLRLDYDNADEGQRVLFLKGKGYWLYNQTYAPIFLDLGEE